jgi:hypothetical protein
VVQVKIADLGQEPGKRRAQDPRTHVPEINTETIGVSLCVSHLLAITISVTLLFCTFAQADPVSLAQRHKIARVLPVSRSA